MISYTLKCVNGHSFDSWFKSAGAFDALKAGGHLTCAVCGNTSVEKTLMAPAVRPARRAPTAAPATEDTAAEPPAPVAHMATPAQHSEMEATLRKMKQQVEANSDYVGGDFAKQARDMHLGDAPERAIYGEANPQEAKALIEDGVPVLPLPFTPTKKAN